MLVKNEKHSDQNDNFQKSASFKMTKWLWIDIMSGFSME